MAEKIKISVFGAGYVGVLTAAGFAKQGHTVTCIDTDRSKVDTINAGEAPFYEPGLPELMAQGRGRIHADSGAEATRDTDVTFLCVGTPSGPDGRIDLSYVKAACGQIGKVIGSKKGQHTVVVKSTVIPGTTRHTIQPALEAASGKKAGVDFGLAMVPEFLREGNAVYDFFHPDRIVFGTEDAATEGLLEKLHAPIEAPRLTTTLETAEMIKYASNAFLATKISFINEIGTLCKEIGVDTYEVARGMGMDTRISPHFLNAGIGFGGSCFSKDVSALRALAQVNGASSSMFDATLKINDAQPLRIVKQAEETLGGLASRPITLLGLAFKPGTDDIRDAPAIKVARELTARGARITAFDPKAMHQFKKVMPSIAYASTAKEAIDASSAVMILTEWDEFKSLDYRGKIVFDGRNALPAALRKGCDYHGLSW